MRKNLALIGAVAAVIATTGVSADETSTAPTPSGESSAPVPANSEPPRPAPEPTTSSASPNADYWAQRKLEMQKRNTEMRMKRVAEMKSAGMDVSAFTPDLLDATKTEESAFWEVAKKIQTAYEIKKRRELVERLKSEGRDVSAITEDLIIGDGQAFWAAMKKIMETARPNAPTPQPFPGDPTGEIKEFLRKDLSPEEFDTLKSALVENGKAISTILSDKNLSVEEKLQRIEAKQRSFAERVEAYVDAAKLTEFRAKNEKKIAQSLEYMRKFLTNAQPQPPRPPMGNMGPRQENPGQRGPEGKDVPERRKNPNAGKRDGEERPGQPQASSKMGDVLSPKLRKALEAKLRAIPEEKKSAVYERAKAAIDAQIEKARSGGNERLIAKLKAIMAVIEDAIGPSDDEELLNSIFN